MATYTSPIKFRRHVRKLKKQLAKVASTQAVTDDILKSIAIQLTQIDGFEGKQSLLEQYERDYDNAEQVLEVSEQPVAEQDYRFLIPVQKATPAKPTAVVAAAPELSLEGTPDDDVLAEVLDRQPAAVKPEQSVLSTPLKAVEPVVADKVGAPAVEPLGKQQGYMPKHLKNKLKTLQRNLRKVEAHIAEHGSLDSDTLPQQIVQAIANVKAKHGEFRAYENVDAFPIAVRAMKQAAAVVGIEAAVVAATPLAPKLDDLAGQDDSPVASPVEPGVTTPADVDKGGDKPVEDANKTPAAPTKTDMLAKLTTAEGPVAKAVAKELQRLTQFSQGKGNSFWTSADNYSTKVKALEAAINTLDADADLEEQLSNSIADKSSALSQALNQHTATWGLLQVTGFFSRQAEARSYLNVKDVADTVAAEIQATTAATL